MQLLQLRAQGILRPDTAIVMNKARYVAYGFEQDVQVGFTEVYEV